MKKIFLLLTVLAFVFAGCSKDDDPIENTPNLSEIKISKEKVGVGQLIVASCKVSVPNNDTLNLAYEWKDDYGFIYNKKDLNWRPTKAGNQTITLTVKNGSQSTTKTTNVTVYDCDYRLTLWNENSADVMISEMPKKPVTSYLPDYLFYLDENDNTIGHAYVLNSNLNIIGGMDLYTKKYSFGEYNGYYEDYKKYRQELIAKYGNPVSENKILDPSAVDEEEFFGDYVLLGKLEFQSKWETKTTNILLNLKKGSTSGTVSLATIYTKK